jgi:predicted nucleic acid-binding protein
MIVLDTNVISALRKPDRHRQVVAWVGAQHEADLYLTAITVGELERGAALKKRGAPGAGAALQAWVAATVTSFLDRILPFGHEEARIWGRLSAEIGNQGTDIQIAATVLARGGTLATRNVRHFAATGVPLVNPYEAKLG